MVLFDWPSFSNEGYENLQRRPRCIPGLRRGFLLRRCPTTDQSGAGSGVMQTLMLDQPQTAGDKVEKNSAEYHGADHRCYSWQGLPERFP